jgi:hypothetical protein
MTDFPVETDAPETGLITTDSVGPIKLNAESAALIEKIIAESDEQKSKELTQLFNANQNKKTMVRVNKLSDLLDTITDQALTRFTQRPDEISNKELFDGLKIVQDLIERGQKQVSNASEAPLIQFNQQNNEVNLGGTSVNNLNRDSRERVKSAVLSLLAGISNAQEVQEPVPETCEVTEDEPVNTEEDDNSGQ